MFEHHATLKKHFGALRTTAEFSPALRSRIRPVPVGAQNVAEPPHLGHDEGAMLTVRLNGVEAYAATNDISLPACKPPSVLNSKPG